MASDIFYNEISKVILKNSKLNITDNHLIETFKKIERISIQKYIYSMQNINYDISPLIKYLIDQNMVSELIHVTSLNYDFITPY